jgi:hypothetical protein
MVCVKELGLEKVVVRRNGGTLIRGVDRGLCWAEAWVKLLEGIAVATLRLHFTTTTLHLI